VIAPYRTALLRALTLSLLVLHGCGGGPGGKPKEAEAGLKKREVPAVRVTAVERRDMQRVLETTSKLESEREVQVMPRIGGIVQTLEAEEGDLVEVGAVLATIDDAEPALAVKDAEVALQESKNALDTLRLALRETEARVKRMQTELEQAVRDHERNQRLFEGEKVASALSLSALEASKLARDNAESDRLDAELARERSQLALAAGETAVERAAITLERARVTLAHTRIAAPFAGVVAQRSIRAGDSVGPSTPAFLLSDTALLRCVFSRPQEELELFAHVGAQNGEGRLSLSATADAYPGRTFLGWIERVSPTIEAQSGQFRVTGRLECEQDNGRVRLLPGMLVRLTIVTERHAATLVVPKRALEREGERRYVWVVRAGLARRIEISEGFSDESWVEVQPKAEAELSEGDPVIVVGARDLADGDAVQVDAGPDEARAVAEPAAAGGTEPR
jgi:membrane fusion protein (multidrug efflux system)